MKHLQFKFASILILELLFLGFTYAGNSNFSLAAPSRSTSAENEFALEINAHRQALGLSPLCVSTSMTSAAVSWTNTMATNEILEHSPDITTGLPPGQWQLAAENVGRGGTVSGLMAAFLNSTGHRQNIENPDFTHLGVGVYITDGGIMYTTHRFADIIGSIPCSFPTPACTAPSSSQNTTASTTSSSANLRTTAPGNLYDWRYRKSSTTTWTNVSWTSAANRTITGLTESTVYQWQNKRRCTNNVISSWSATENFTTAAATCARPRTSQNTVASITSSCSFNHKFFCKSQNNSFWQFI